MAETVEQHACPGASGDLVVDDGIDADVAVVIAVVAVILLKRREIIRVTINCSEERKK